MVLEEILSGKRMLSQGGPFSSYLSHSHRIKHVSSFQRMELGSGWTQMVWDPSSLETKLGDFLGSGFAHRW